MRTFIAKFDIGDKVNIDGHFDLIGVITEICVRTTESDIAYEVSWWSNGDLKTAYFASARLEAEE